MVTASATGNPQLVRFSDSRPMPDGDDAVEKAINLLTDHRRFFGFAEPTRELRLVAHRRDPLGGEQVVFEQQHRGIPVFGTLVRVHLDADGSVTTVNGSFVSSIDIDTVPHLNEIEAETRAVQVVTKQTGRPVDFLTVAPAQLKVYREGLLRGVPGPNHLTWEVEVASPPEIREVLYLDAHDGRLIDQRSEIHNLHRAIHIGSLGSPIWSEGDPLPYSSASQARDAEINELIATAGDTFSLFANLTGGQYLSYDGHDATMNSVYDSNALSCPNAAESGGVTAFCVGMVSDDVAAHEWTHAYTEWTHGLIYQWQSGALNEAYSDIYGELIDQLNGRGGDFPGDVRPNGACSSAGGQPSPRLEINDPASVAGTYGVGGAAFNPIAPWEVTGTVALANDGTGTPTYACTSLISFPIGSIALVDRGTCFFREKILHAQSAGAIGVIVVNNEGDQVFEMGGDLPRLDIPAVFLGQSDGDLLKSVLGQGVTATLTLNADFKDSVRWLVGEDTSALGSIRDMWSPICFGDPDRVGSSLYHCSSMDSGGVHTNSGIPNHAYSLLVDGGSFNNRTVEAIGHTKTARIYWRAMATYQTPVTDFSNHADLLEASCRDLIGAPLFDLQSGAPSAESITAADCLQIQTAVTAVEMRHDPDQCHFRPLLIPDSPPVDRDATFFSATFDTDPGDRWMLTNHGVHVEYEPRDWLWTDEVPTGGDGGAFFAIDSVFIGDCRPGSDDQSGVMELTSPEILIPHGSSSVVLTFDHWVATEPEWDGGNLKISVNGGPFDQISVSDFLFNLYNNRITSNNTNPLAGQWAFTGSNEGTVSGSWGQSQVDLRRIASPGDRIRLRFDFGVDGCNGAKGWYLDNVKVLGDAVAATRMPSGRVAP